MSDVKHRLLQNEYVKFSKRWGRSIEIEVEKEYNNYGQRGFVDVLTKLKHGKYVIAEIKPYITDIGALIRQVKKAKNNIDNTTELIEIVCYLNFDNIKIILDNFDLFENSGLYYNFFFWKNKSDNSYINFKIGNHIYFTIYELKEYFNFFNERGE